VDGPLLGPCTLWEVGEDPAAPDISQLAAVLGDIAEGVTVQDAAGRLIYANAAAARMAGYASAEAMTRDADHVIEQFELLDEMGKPFPPEQLPGRQILQGRPADEVVIQFRDPDTGYARWSILNATPIHAPDGRLLLVVNLFRDITERKRQTDALREAMLERDRAMTDLQNALRVRDEFLSAASHDLKNPLATIKATAQLLLRRLDTPGEVNTERLRDGLHRVDAIATRAARLVEELLDLSRVQMGQPLELERQPTDLIALAREVTSEHQQATERHTLVIQSPEPALLGDWDGLRLGRVLSNLIDNAIKYSPDGGPVLVRVARDGDWAVVAVEDRGIGIPEAELSRVFQRFQRGSNAVERAGGSGIGLASAHRIIESHGGSIAVQSQEGTGSTFIVRLPVKSDGRV
jgi:PAS domain S-box-containing protein